MLPVLSPIPEPRQYRRRGLISAGWPARSVVAPSVDQSVAAIRICSGTEAISGNPAYVTTQPAPPASSIAYSNADGLAASRTFDPAAMGKPNANLIDFWPGPRQVG